jgi:hypothetical protein
MPQWIHDRAYHILSKNPNMERGTAFAIATQQSHKLNKTPKGYGTSEGKRKAQKKYQSPRRSYIQTADPEGSGKKYEKAIKKEASLMIGRYINLASSIGFADELHKIAALSTGPVGRAVGQAAKSFGKALKGPTRQYNVEIPRPDKLPGEFVSKTLTERVPLREALKDPSLKGEAYKTIAARTGAGLGVGVIGKKHVERKKERQYRRLGRAYVQGARDMYSRMHKAANLSGVNQIPTQAPPPPTALGSVSPKAPPKGGSLAKTPTYSKVHSAPTSVPASNYQPVAAAPSVKS